MSKINDENTIDSTLFPGYEIGEKLGEGGGGCVYEAYHKNLRKKVVIKKLKSGYTDEAKKRAEVDIMKNLRHSYIPNVIDYFEKDNIAYTIMDYIEGKSFGQLLKEGRKFSEKEVIKYYEQLCEAVSYLHSQKIPVIHGDIKPDNIMLTPEDQICLIDFNISGISENGKAYTDGYTAGYSAPEQYLQYKEIVTQQLNSKIEESRSKSEKDKKSGFQDDKTELLREEISDHTELLSDNQTELLVENEIDETELLIDDEDDLTVGLFEDWDSETEMLTDSEKTELLGRIENLESYDRGETVCIFDDELSEMIIKDKENGNIKRVSTKASLNEGSSKQLILIDKKSDVYSIAATMFHLYTGEKYKEGKKLILGASTSDGLMYIFNKALSKKSGNRFSDATEMLSAIKAIYKKDKRYKKVVLLQNLFTIISILMIASGVICIFLGKEKQGMEWLEAYNMSIHEMQDARENLDEELLVISYSKALEIDDKCIDAYYQMCLAYFERNDYVGAINYIETDVLTIPEMLTQEGISDVYYILGMSYLEMEEYKNADNSFKNAIKYNSEKMSYYIEDAISLARQGEISAAKELLESAKQKGLDDSSSALVGAEISFALGDYKEAETGFIKSINESKDDYSKLSAYIMLSKTYDKYPESEDVYDKNIEMLNVANSQLPMDYHPMILQRIAQVAINAASTYSDCGYEEIAIDALEKAEKYGATSFVTYNNLAILYQRVSDYENAKIVIDEMMNKYPEDYKTYKRAAFLEIDMQSSLDENLRNYMQFEEYYQTAKNLYEKNKDITDSVDMQKLDEAYQELIDKGWL